MAPKTNHKRQTTTSRTTRLNWDITDPLNQVDYGFNHITMPSHIFEPHYPDPLPDLTPPSFEDDLPTKPKPRSAKLKEQHYLLLVRRKIEFTKRFLDIEKAGKIDPNRNMAHDSAAKSLASSPIPLSFATQEYIRDIVGITGKIMEYEGNEEALAEEDVEEKMQEMAQTYLHAWQMVRSEIAVFLPGKTETERVIKAEDVLVRELGKMVSEPGVETDEVADEKMVDSDQEDDEADEMEIDG